MTVSKGNAIDLVIGVPFNLPGGTHQTDESLSIDDLAEITKILAFFILDLDENDI